MTKNWLLTVTLLATLFFGGFSDLSASMIDGMADWKKALAQKLAKEQRYPRSAIQRGIEGVAKVRIIISKDGSITAHEVIELTGEQVLDREIEKLVERMNPLPALPDGKENLALVLPIVWRLK